MIPPHPPSAFSMFPIRVRHPGRNFNKGHTPGHADVRGEQLGACFPRWGPTDPGQGPPTPAAPLVNWLSPGGPVLPSMGWLSPDETLEGMG